MADKQTKLSIVIRAVDQATAKIAAINARLDAVTKPFRNFKEALGDLREKSGLDDVIGGFKGVGSAVAGALAKVAMIGGAVGVAVAGLFKLVDGFDDLGDKAESMGVSVDFLAQLRYAAERSGASVESLDTGLKGFTTSLGQARAGTGRMHSFLEKVSPALLRQVKAAKSNEEAFGLLAAAAEKIVDPAKRAAFAQKTLGDASLAPLLGKGAKGIKELRDRYLDLAGSQEGAAAEAGKVDDSLKDLKAASDGAKAALVTGLAPALKIVVDRLATFFKENRAGIAEWASNLGKKLPGAISSLIGAVGKVIDTIKPFVDSTTKLKVIAVALGAIIVGPLVSAVYALGVALLTTPVGWVVAGLAAIAAGAYLLHDNWEAVSGFFTDLWDGVADKFGWAAHVIKLVLWPIIGMATLFIGAWDEVSGFFVGLWDGISSVFQKAWEIIGAIVDKVVGAVKAVKDAVGAIGESVSYEDMKAKYGPRPEVSAQAGAIAGRSGSSSSEAHVTLEIKNAPPGSRVSTDPRSKADVDTTLGILTVFP